MGELNLADFAQTLRRAHCSKQERDHDCVGTCTITVKGVELDCRLCGKDAQPLVLELAHRRESQRAKEILHVAGVDFNKLAPTTQRDVIREFMKDCCPGCAARLDPKMTGSMMTCVCGMYFKAEYGGWSRSAAKIREDDAQRTQRIADLNHDPGPDF